MIDLKVIKSANKSYIFTGTSNKIKYSIVITNLGNERVNSIKLKDTLSEGVYLVPGTFNVDGCPKDILNFKQSIDIGSIESGGNTIITFDAEVEKNCLLKFITNKARIIYFDDNNNINWVESNELIIPIINIDVCIKKDVDKIVAKVGEVLSYSVLIRNNSNVDIEDVIFYDILPRNLEILPSSVIIDGQVQYIGSFNGGVPIGIIKSNSSKLISFQAVIMYLPRQSIISNVSNIEYNYSVNDNGILVTSIGESISNCSTTKIIKVDC